MKKIVLIFLFCLPAWAQVEEQVILSATAVLTARENNAQARMADLLVRLAEARRNYDAAVGENQKAWAVEWNRLKQQAVELLDKVGAVELPQALVEYRRHRISLRWELLTPRGREIILAADQIERTDRVSHLQAEADQCLQWSRSNLPPNEKVRWRQAYAQKLAEIQIVQQELIQPTRTTIIRVGPPVDIRR